MAEGHSSDISADSAKIDPANEGKLVHLTGTTTCTETFSDPDFDVSVNAISLYRDVEMYQWSEIASSKTNKKSRRRNRNGHDLDLRKNVVFFFARFVGF